MRTARCSLHENEVVKPNFPVCAITAHAALSSANVETSPPCMTPTGPWCSGPGVKRVTTSSPSLV